MITRETSFREKPSGKVTTRKTTVNHNKMLARIPYEYIGLHFKEQFLPHEHVRGRAIVRKSRPPVRPFVCNVDRLWSHRLELNTKLNWQTRIRQSLYYRHDYVTGAFQLLGELLLLLFGV